MAKKKLNRQNIAQCPCGANTKELFCTCSHTRSYKEDGDLLTTEANKATTADTNRLGITKVWDVGFIYDTFRTKHLACLPMPNQSSINL